MLCHRSVITANQWVFKRSVSISVYANKVEFPLMATSMQQPLQLFYSPPPQRRRPGPIIREYQRPVNHRLMTNVHKTSSFSASLVSIFVQYPFIEKRCSPEKKVILHSYLPIMVTSLKQPLPCHFPCPQLQGGFHVYPCPIEFAAS